MGVSYDEITVKCKECGMHNDVKITTNEHCVVDQFVDVKCTRCKDNFFVEIWIKRRSLRDGK